MSDALKTLIEEQGRAFEEFKSANDAKLEALEKKDHVPADLVEKVGRIDSDLNLKFRQIQDELTKLSRPGAQIHHGGDAQEHRDALLAYIRRGDETALREIETKTMSGFSDPDGGVLVDSVTDSAIDRVASTVAAFGGLASSTNLANARSWKKLVKTAGVSGGHVGVEEESPGETAGMTFAEIEVVPQGIYAEPWVPNDLLQDAGYDLMGDIEMEAGITFGELEGSDFIVGTGVKSPRGILTYPVVANSAYTWGSVGYTASGGAGAFAASNPGDALISLQHSLRQAYRQGASFLMADTTLSQVRQLKDGSGNFYLFNPDPSGGFAGSVLGSGVSIDDYMPVIAANSYSIAYGNWQRAYKIVRRSGISLIVDRVTKKGYTKFYMVRRTGGGLYNFEAIKVMKFAAS